MSLERGLLSGDRVGKPVPRPGRVVCSVASVCYRLDSMDMNEVEMKDTHVFAFFAKHAPTSVSL